MSEEHLSIRQAAERLGVAYRTVYRWIRTGKLEAVQPNGEHGSWRVPASALAARKNDPPDPAAPRPVTGDMQKIVRQLEDRERQIQQLAG